MSTHVGIDALRYLGRIGSVVVLCLVLTSCGLGGDDDDPDPTATTETELESQPTQQPEETAEPTETRAPFRLIPSSPESTNEPDTDATADVATPGTTDQEATSEVESSPEATPAGVPNDETETPTPESGEPSTPATNAGLPANSVTGSDGTSGASGVAGLLETGAGSPEATPEASGGTEVDSCDVVEAPPFTGESADYVVIEEVNFRVGPGADCDSVLDGPLEVGTTMTILSDPVVRTGDDNEWVQVQIGDETGWVATEFIEVAE